MSSGERKRMVPKPVACETRRGLRRGGCGTLRGGPPSSGVRGVFGVERYASGRPERVRAPYTLTCLVRWVFPSSAGPVESRVNLPGPPGKAEYSLVTDSARVP